MLMNRMNTPDFFQHTHENEDKSPSGNTKTRIIVKRGSEYIALKLDDVVFFYSVDKLVYVYDKHFKKYMLDWSLAKIEEMLDKKIFYRANRQYIVSINYIKSFKTVEKVKLQLFMNLPSAHEPIIVSQVTATHFRKWIQEV
jgi:DNA-binding LytR/AlgR family response regulator